MPGYVTSLDTDQSAVQALIELITVQKTDFFRDPMQSEALVELLPQLASPVTIWSAGCSNGQEPYSLAMVLAESGVADWRVIASDVSIAAMERTRRARYSTVEMDGVTAVRRAQHFAQVGDDWEVLPSLSRRVEVVRHSLTAEAPPFAPGRCQIVFCRNVLIYVQAEDVRVFVERVARWLPLGGWLFLGYSESLWQVTDQFDLVRLGDAFVYRKRDASAPAVAPPAMTRPTRRSRTGRPRPAPRHMPRGRYGEGQRARGARAGRARPRIGSGGRPGGGKRLDACAGRSARHVDRRRPARPARRRARAGGVDTGVSEIGVPPPGAPDPASPPRHRPGGGGRAHRVEAGLRRGTPRPREVRPVEPRGGARGVRGGRADPMLDAKLGPS